MLTGALEIKLSPQKGKSLCEKNILDLVDCILTLGEDHGFYVTCCVERRENDRN